MKMYEKRKGYAEATFSNEMIRALTGAQTMNYLLQSQSLL